MAVFALAVCALAFAGLAVQADPAGTPVDKVVDLIEELKGKLETDSTTEQAAFDKLACWCEETTDHKADDIEAAMADIKRLGTNILELKGKVAVLSSEIDELKKTTADNQKSQDEATKLREGNNKKFLEEKAEMEATIGSLEKAILVLSGAGTKKASLLEEKATLESTKVALRSAVEALPADNNLSPDKMKMLGAFLQDPAAYYDQKAQKSAAYDPASATIQGLLKDMYDTFVSNLEKETISEADQQQQFEDLISAKTKELNTLLATTEAKASEKSEAEIMLADSSEEMDDTSKLMKADTKFFEDTKAECTTRADEWSERCRARAEELAGIEKAVAILTSDDAKALFSKAIKPGKETMLFQEVALTQSQAEKPLAKAAQTLRRHAKKAKSLRLAALATQVRNMAQLRNAGAFTGVVVQIEKMRAVLAKEEQDDMDTKDWCKAETFKNEEEASKYEYKVEKMIAKVEKLEDQVTAMEATVAETVREMEDTRKEMTQMEDDRVEEHNAFAEAKADDEGAIALLEAAIASLSSFYGNNKGSEMGEVQGSVDGFLQAPADPISEKPAFAPSSAGSRKGESKGIVSILTMLKEDLEDEVKNGVKNEVAGQKAFEEEMKKANESMERLKARKANLEDSIATADQSVDDSKQNKDNAAELKVSDEEYLAEIKPDCMWMLENFDARRASRAQEVDGLVEAEALLEGAVPALVQVAPVTKAFLQAA